MLQNQKHSAAKPTSFRPECAMPVTELHSLLNEARLWAGRYKDSFVLSGKSEDSLSQPISSSCNVQETSEARCALPGNNGGRDLLLPAFLRNI